MQRFRYLLMAGTLAGVLQSDSALAQLGPADIIKPPTVPPEIEVPSGNMADLKGVPSEHRTIFACLPARALL